MAFKSLNSTCLPGLDFPGKPASLNRHLALENNLLHLQQGKTAEP
jgi:hypothetical protein